MTSPQLKRAARLEVRLRTDLRLVERRGGQAHQRDALLRMIATLRGVCLAMEPVEVQGGLDALMDGIEIHRRGLFGSPLAPTSRGSDTIVPPSPRGRRPS